MAWVLATKYDWQYKVSEVVFEYVYERFLFDEDPVTGAANGALAEYLYLGRVLKDEGIHRLKIGQGDAMNRPETLYVTITLSQEHPVIDVARQAVTSIEANVNLL